MMTTITTKSITASFIAALESAYKLELDCHPAERLNILVGEDLVYGKDSHGAIVDKLDDKLVALLSATIIDERPPIERRLEDQILELPIDIKVDGTGVLNYYDGNYAETALLDKIRNDAESKETFATVRDEAIDAVVISQNKTNALLNIEQIPVYVSVVEETEVVDSLEVEETVLQQQILTEEESGVTLDDVVIIDDIYSMVQPQLPTSYEVEATPEAMEALIKELLEQSRSVFMVPEVQLGTQTELQTQVNTDLQADTLSELQQQTPIQVRVLAEDNVPLNEDGVSNNDVVDDHVEEILNKVEEQETPQVETAVIAVSLADEMGINSGASRIFVSVAENNLLKAIAETGSGDNNEAVDGAYRDLMRAKDVNSQVDASLREQQAHKLMTAVVAIGMASGKEEIKTRGGEYVVKLGSDGSALLTSASRGVIYDGLPNIAQASINLMSDLDINSLSKAVEHTAAYMREAEVEKQQLDLE